MTAPSRTIARDAGGALLALCLVGAIFGGRIPSRRSSTTSFSRTSIFTGGDVADFVTPAIERLATRVVDFPPTATAPGFIYRFDFETATYVRELTSMGPVFAERPETIGRHRLEDGVSVLFGDLDAVDGGGSGRRAPGASAS